MTTETVSILGQQIPVALVIVYLQNWIKKSDIPWLTYESSRLNHIASILLSGIGTFGLAIAHTGSFAAGGTLIITFPSSTVFFTSLWHWLSQYILTKTGYHLLQPQLNPSTEQTPQPVVVMPGSKNLAPIAEPVIVKP
jgi:hypothetical protein